MPPRAPRHNQVHGASRHAKHQAKLPERQPAVGPEPANFANVGFGEHSAVNFLAVRTEAALAGVANVYGVRRVIEMRWVHARWVVATMASEMNWERPMRQQKRNPVGSTQLSLNLDGPVSADAGRRPDPAFPLGAVAWGPV